MRNQETGQPKIGKLRQDTSPPTNSCIFASGQMCWVTEQKSEDFKPTFKKNIFKILLKF